MENAIEKLDFHVFPNLQNPLEIKIPIYEGPLDLLLHLIRKKELDIYKVELSELTNSYLAYVERMEAVNLDYAGEFLEIAATLIWIKSKSLLPKPPIEEDGDEEDPEERLRRQLIEYQKYKQAAFLLSCCDMLGRDVFLHPASDDDELQQEDVSSKQVFEEISLYGLMDAFRRVMERPRPSIHVVESDHYRLEDRLEELIRLFRVKSHYHFEDLFFHKDQSRAMLIITFMAILEMVRLGLLRVRQANQADSVYCHASDDFHKNVAKWFEHHQPLSELNIA
ncbi:MAG: segregation/condensation protein A [SAR324 cluster bacterium]|nr:segregation/condensation protein A [SAR324 cluster bacterium]